MEIYNVDINFDFLDFAIDFLKSPRLTLIANNFLALICFADAIKEIIIQLLKMHYLVKKHQIGKVKRNFCSNWIWQNPLIQNGIELLEQFVIIMECTTKYERSTLGKVSWHWREHN